MSDDRDFREYGYFKREPWITFEEYVRKVMSEPGRSQEFDLLVKLHGFEKLEKIMSEGKKENESV